MPSCALRAFCALLCAGLLLGCEAREGERPGADGSSAAVGERALRPNLLLLIADDQAWGDFGFMGHEHVRTPNLDRLASEGLLYTRGYVPHSVCRPSLATLATGLYPHQHGITSNWPPGFEDAAEPAPASAAERAALDERFSIRIEQVPRLAALLGRAGYRSLQAGKWWEGDYRRGGFTRGTPDREEAWTIGRETIEPVTAFIDESQAAGSPFFVWYAPLLPHAPHDPPDALLARYRGLAPDPVARYWAMCERFDQTVGELLGHLEARGLERDTLVVFLVDNGWQTHGRSPLPVRSKLSPYDTGVRTPLLLRWPGRVGARRDEATPVSSVDVVPTLLRAAGVPPPPELPGVDLLDRPAVEGRGRAFGAIFTRVARSFDEPAASLRFRYLVEGPWKLIEPNPALEPDASSELYQLLLDPGEVLDVASVQAERVRAMRRRLDEWWDPTVDDGAEAPAASRSSGLGAVEPATD